MAQEFLVVNITNADVVPMTVGLTFVVPCTFFIKGAHMLLFLHRIGFSFALRGVEYAIHTGNVRNGSGIATSMFISIPGLEFLAQRFRRT